MARPRQLVRLAGADSLAGFFGLDGQQHLFTGHPDGSVRETIVPGSGDVTGTLAITKFAGLNALSAYLGADGAQHVITCSDHQKISETYYKGDQDRGQDLLGNVPIPFEEHFVVRGYATRDGFQHVLVWNDAGTITELFWRPAMGVGRRDVPLPTTHLLDFAAFATPDGFEHVVACTTKEIINHVKKDGQVVAQYSVGQLTNPPAVFLKVSGYFAPDGFLHVVSLSSAGELTDHCWRPDEDRPPSVVRTSFLAMIPNARELTSYFSSGGYQHTVVLTRDGDLIDLSFVVRFTPFRPQYEGYAFGNHWVFDPAEKAVFNRIFQTAIGPAVAALGPLIAPAFGLGDFLGALVGIPPGALESAATAGLGLAITGQLNDLVDQALPDYYGLCGGMAWSSLDYYRAGWVIPRGFPPGPAGAVDVEDKGHPQRTSTEGTVLRDYIWERLKDSLLGGVAEKTIEWMAVLHLVPTSLGGGAPELFDRTKAEWNQLKSHLDAGEPWPIGLIGTTKVPTQNHQILVYGYRDNLDKTAVLFVYDNSCPDVEHTIDLDFRDAMKELTAPYTCVSPKRGPLKGFFCEPYQQRTPPVAVGIPQKLTADPPSGTAAVGRPLTLSCEVRNVGFGDSPPLELFFLLDPVSAADLRVQTLTSPEEASLGFAPVGSPVVREGGPSPPGASKRSIGVSAPTGVPAQWSVTVRAQLRPMLEGRDVTKALPLISSGTEDFESVVVQSPPGPSG